MGQTFHIRKHPKKKYQSTLFTYYMIVVGLAAPLMTIPQLTKLWSEQDASGLAPSTWIAYTIVAASWLVYGIIYKEKPIIFTHLFLFPINLLIVVGILLFSSS